MSWTSLDEDDAISFQDAEDRGGPDIPEPWNGRLKNNEIEENTQLTELRETHDYSSRDQSPGPFVQEPVSDNDILFRREARSQQQLRNLLASKDERIRTLQKLVNGQREQLYHFLRISLKEETLLDLKKTCRQTEMLNQNENICMALDKFKYDNKVPSEQTLVRENVFRTLMKIERLVKHQTEVVKTMERELRDAEVEDTESSVEVSSIQQEEELIDLEKLLSDTNQIQRTMQMLKVQLKQLALIEQERIDLVERVYSMPTNERQYYAHLVVIEREKQQLRCDIDRLTETHRDLKHKCCLLEEVEQQLNKCIDVKMANLDLNNIKPGLERHVELMEMVERGELSLITMTNDEKGNFTDDFVKLSNENAEISERLKDFEKVTQERDDLKRQIEVLVESSLHLQNEVKELRLNNKTDELLQQLRQTCLERDEMMAKVDRLTKEGLGVLMNGGETMGKVFEERDQLQLKLAEYPTMEDLRSLRFKASQAEEYLIEVERLKMIVAELEEVKATRTFLLDKSGMNQNMVNPLGREMYRNMSKQMENLKVAEGQRERLVIELSRYKYALLRQEEEIRDLVSTVDKLKDQVNVLRTNVAVNPAEGTPEGPEVTPVLNPEEEKRLEMIRGRVRHETSKTSSSSQEVPLEKKLYKTTFIESMKSFLGLDASLTKTID